MEQRKPRPYHQEEQYIIDCISWDGYTTEKPPVTDREKMQFMIDCFKAEYGWNIAQQGTQGALKEWLSGLPSSCGIEYRNHAILELATAWGSLPTDATEHQEDKILNNWFNFMAVRILTLAKFLKVEV